MKSLIYTMIFWPLLVFAQERQGIEFAQGLDLRQALAKAKTENKYVFVDAFATGCDQCAEMDDRVASSEKVGELVNDRFISVKIQMDKTNNDPEVIKKGYATADFLVQRYNITGPLTYLFFSPEGRAVHKGSGPMPVSDFIVLAADATNPGRQYYTVLDNYRQGRKDYGVLPWLINAARNFGEKDLVQEMARDYIHNYLDKLSDDEFCTRANLKFLDDFPQMTGSEDRAFAFYYRQSAKVDVTMGHVRFGQSHADTIITAEEIAPVESRAGQDKIDVDWAKIARNIQKKYGPDYARRNVLNAQKDWYIAHRSVWPGNAAKYLVRWLDENGLPGGLGNVYLGNDLEMVVLRFDDNKEDLDKSIKWMEALLNLTQDVSIWGGWVDPYAGLLYKVGRVQEAIAWQEVDVQLWKMFDSRGSGRRAEKRMIVLEKMKRGEKFGQLWLGKKSMYNDN